MRLLPLVLPLLALRSSQLDRYCTAAAARRHAADDCIFCAGAFEQMAFDTRTTEERCWRHVQHMSYGCDFVQLPGPDTCSDRLSPVHVCAMTFEQLLYVLPASHALAVRGAFACDTL